MSYENSQLLLILGGKLEHIITQLAHEVNFLIYVNSVIVQVLCGYSTLPLYAIVTQMGSTFKKAIFDEHVQEGLVGWAQKAKKRRGKNVVAGEGVPMRSLGDHQEATSEKGTAKLIQEERVENSVI
ncbi:MLO-like protein 1 [Ananas comosus]|uniref:MLO-like protein 1 n=1 Tax=Ananas comosus TaxID=4615 RepID=A0A199VGL9_ANACO|nr:MLO-like protein 1 [Ananas comosus]